MKISGAERLASYSATNVTYSTEARLTQRDAAVLVNEICQEEATKRTHTALLCEIKPAGLSDCQGMLSQKMCQSTLATTSRTFTRRRRSLLLPSLQRPA